jgi:hypothetical protein
MYVDDVYRSAKLGGIQDAGGVRGIQIGKDTDIQYRPIQSQPFCKKQR